MSKYCRYSVEFPEQGEPAIGSEVIRIRHDDGRVEDMRLHEYARVYSLPGLYEEIVHNRLGCRSPHQIASMLAHAVDRIGRGREQTRVLDLAAGNGVSGEALTAQGLRPVLGTDIVPVAREAALRDRPHTYHLYLTLNLLALSANEKRAIQALQANAVSCVAPVGTASQQLPPAALMTSVALVADDALVAYMHDPTLGVDDPITAELWADELGASAEQLERRRYVHRRTVVGHPYEMDAVVWRVRRRYRTVR